MTAMRVDAFEAVSRATGRARLAYAWMLALCLHLFMLPAPAAEMETPSWIDQHLSGQSRTSYRYRSSGEDHDSDVYQYLYLRGRDVAAQHLDFYVSGRLHVDTDGTTSSLASNIYAGAEDTGSYTEEHLYQLYAEAHDRAGTLRLRVGRQYIDIADSMHLDGGQLMLFENGRLGGRAFYGLPVSYYGSVSGDAAGGLSVVGRPWAGNRTRLTYSRYDDDSEDATDERYHLQVRQQLIESLRTRMRVSMLNDELQTAGLDLFWYPVDVDFSCVGGAHQWNSFEARTRAFSPYYRLAGDLEPYTYVYARLARGIRRWLQISAGGSARLVEGGREDAYNRSYQRYDLTLGVKPTRHWSASLSGEFWDARNGNRTQGVSGEIRYRRPRQWELRAGAGYLAYDYGFDSDLSFTLNGGQTQVYADGTRIETSPDVYTYFLRGKWYITRAVSLRIRGEIEDNSMVDDLSYGARASVVARL